MSRAALPAPANGGLLRPCTARSGDLLRQDGCVGSGASRKYVVKFYHAAAPALVNSLACRQRRPPSHTGGPGRCKRQQDQGNIQIKTKFHLMSNFRSSGRKTLARATRFLASSHRQLPAVSQRRRYGSIVGHICCSWAPRLIGRRGLRPTTVGVLGRTVLYAVCFLKPLRTVEGCTPRTLHMGLRKRDDLSADTLTICEGSTTSTVKLV